jgi:hypothetical protein
MLGPSPGKSMEEANYTQRKDIVKCFKKLEKQTE